MRFICLLFLLLIAPASFAETPAKSNAPAVVSAAAKPKPSLSAWRSLNKSSRRDIIAAWKDLPEATRPAFPIFRDNALEKMLAPAQTARKIK